MCMCVYMIKSLFLSYSADQSMSIISFNWEVEVEGGHLYVLQIQEN